MMSCSKDDRLWWGLVAFVVGAVVLLERFDVVPATTWDYLWPSILVVSGIKWMLSGTCEASQSCEMGCEDCGEMACSCEAMPVVKKPVAKKSKSKRK